jgi:hypothetical protein
MALGNSVIDQAVRSVKIAINPAAKDRLARIISTSRVVDQAVAIIAGFYVVGV